MGTLRILLLFLGIAALPLSSARAQLWQGAELYAPKQMSVGIYGQVYGPTYNWSSAVMGLGQFSYGVSERFQLEARLGLGMIDFYVGAFAKFSLFETGIFKLSTLVGLHKQLSIYADWNIIGSLELEHWRFYLAPIFNASFAVPVGLALIPGIVLKISSRYEIYAEGDLNITGLFWAGSAGFKYVFDPT